jgi:hypothetical protein
MEKNCQEDRRGKREGNRRMDVQGDPEPAGTSHEDPAGEVRVEHQAKGAGEMVAKDLLKKGGVD